MELFGKQLTQSRTPRSRQGCGEQHQRNCQLLKMERSLQRVTEVIPLQKEVRFLHHDPTESLCCDQILQQRHGGLHLLHSKQQQLAHVPFFKILVV